MQVRSLSCVVVDLLVQKCIRFISSIAPRHWIVAFRKHVFPVFRSPGQISLRKGSFWRFAWVLGVLGMGAISFLPT